MTKSEHQRAPWRDPSREQPADKIKAGLEDALAFAKGDTTRGRIVDPPAARPPPEHADVVWHWLSTPRHPRGEPMYWERIRDEWVAIGGVVFPIAAAEAGWRYIAPGGPPL